MGHPSYNLFDMIQVTTTKLLHNMVNLGGQILPGYFF